MADKFVLGDLFSNIVSDSDTSAEVIVLLPLEQLKADPRNFYSLEGIEELADNIRFCGLQQPVRVRRDGNAYAIVSGHRRTAAYKMLCAEDPDKWGKIPCIVEDGQGSAAMQELKIILANRDTRVMKPADIRKQAERIQELFVQLKDEGVEFKGRMRDAVAAACQVSSSKLARLAAIKKGLTDPELVAAFERGDLAEETAYQLSKTSDYAQNLIRERFTESDGRFIMESRRAERLAKALSQFSFPEECPASPGPCADFPLSARTKAIIERSRRYPWEKTECGSKCCLQCSEKAVCDYSCRFAAEQVEAAKKKEKAERRSAKAKEKKQHEHEDAPNKTLWARVDGRLRERGMGWADFAEAVKPIGIGADTAERLLHGGAKRTDPSPYGIRISVAGVATLRAAAKVLGCTIDELIGEGEGEA